MKRTTRHILPVLVCSANAALLFLGCASEGKDPGTPDFAGKGHAGASAAGAAVGGGSSAAGQSSGSGGSAGSSVAGNTSSAAGSNAAGGSVGSAGASDGAGGTSGGAGGKSGGASGAGGKSGGASGSGGSSPSGGAGGKGGGVGGSGGASAGAGGGGSTTPGMSAGCGKAPTIASNMYNNGKNIPLTVGTMQRRYILSVPTNYDNKKPYKLVIAYHALDSNDNKVYFENYYNLQPLSKDTTIFVAPNGQQNGSPCSGTGRGESGCGWPNPSGSDMAFADALVKTIEENFCVDTNRIFATGWSFGGSMSYATACQRPLGAANGYIRAIAVYSGSMLSGSCTPSKPVSYYASHGTHDGVLCYDSSSSGCATGNGILLAQNFAKANGCTWATPQKVTSGNHVCTSMTGCTSGYPVEFCSFNGDHDYNPKDPGQGTSWEYQKAWDFLNQF